MTSIRPAAAFVRSGARAGALLGAVLLSLAAAPAPAAPQEGGRHGAEIRSRAIAILERGGFQTELPGNGESGADPAGDAGAGLEGSGSSGEEPRGNDAPARGIDRFLASSVEAAEDLWWFLSILAIVAIGVVVLTLLLRAGTRTVPARAARAALAPDRAILVTHDPVPAPAEAPARLASEGRFAEAIHALLLQLLGSLATRHRLVVTGGATGREIAARVPDEAAREALHAVVLTSERWRFAGRPLAEGDWQRSVEQARRAGCEAGG